MNPSPNRNIPAAIPVQERYIPTEPPYHSEAWRQSNVVLTKLWYVVDSDDLLQRKIKAQLQPLLGLHRDAITEVKAALQTRKQPHELIPNELSTVRHELSKVYGKLNEARSLNSDMKIKLDDQTKTVFELRTEKDKLESKLESKYATDVVSLSDKLKESTEKFKALRENFEKLSEQADASRLVQRTSTNTLCCQVEDLKKQNKFLTDALNPADKQMELRSSKRTRF
uniref:Uncharacterized protein n=1 Tax=viral metagenome TaxID=1070528 RepID=A0A6C0KGS0_9ZZZZ